MAHLGIVNLAERLLHQSQTPTEESASAPTQNQQISSPSATPDPARPASTPPSNDQFTASSESNASDATAQAAGLFSVTASSLFTAAANFILGALAGPGTGTSSGAEQPGAAAPAKAVPAQAAALPAGASPASRADSASLTAAAQTTVTPAVTASTLVPAPTLTEIADTNTRLESLNDSLAAQGLGQPDIVVIDRVASAFGDYNPTTYSDLLYRLEGLASPPQGNATPTTAAGAENPAAAGNTAPPSASTAATNPSTAVPVDNSAPAGAIPNGSSATGQDGSSLRGLVIHSAGSNGSPARATASRTSPKSAGNPRFEEATPTPEQSSRPALALGKARGA
ncbi:MAG: hypothetical protein ABSG16_15315 [Candidatus Acidiferrum sp.]|jgi:hypothetical protein